MLSSVSLTKTGPGPASICKLTGCGDGIGGKPSSTIHCLEYVCSCMGARVVFESELEKVARRRERRVNNGVRAAQM